MSCRDLIRRPGGSGQSARTLYELCLDVLAAKAGGAKGSSSCPSGEDDGLSLALDMSYQASQGRLVTEAMRMDVFVVMLRQGNIDALQQEVSEELVIG